MYTLVIFLTVMSPGTHGISTTTQRVSVESAEVCTAVAKGIEAKSGVYPMRMPKGSWDREVSYDYKTFCIKGAASEKGAAAKPSKLV